LSEYIELPLDEHDRLADTPLLDSLRYESSPGGFSISFIPSNEVSSEEKELIFVRGDSVEGRLLAPLYRRLQRLLQASVDRVIHSGGGNYTFIFSDGASRQLDDSTFNPKTAQWLFDTLKHMAHIAECAFALADASRDRVA
jgi:hypothetical protein